jgi:hypothetical protein
MPKRLKAFERKTVTLNCSAPEWKWQKERGHITLAELIKAFRK